MGKLMVEVLAFIQPILLYFILNGHNSPYYQADKEHVEAENWPQL